MTFIDRRQNMNQETLGLILIITMPFLGILPLFVLLISSRIELHETRKEGKKIRKEISDIIDRM